uniref:uncharacterized protein LOC122607783 isoform X2 n=1 Tax=Erigeron canadensis TaxID=72917 RepID=UPI001CB89E97|nr:uncharacterized protein LOC122607783 isoform X2 [Erigeron canadensis]
MELELDDGLFWLPTEFLKDVVNDDDENLFSGKNSDLSSPVESVFGTESDDEDYLSDLSQKLAHSTLEDEEENRVIKSTNVTVGSPQSTLCGYNGTANTKSFTNSKNYHMQQIHAAQLKQQQLIKQQQLLKQQQYQYQQQFVQQNRGRNVGGVNMKPVAAPLSAWPTLHQYQPPPPPGTGMRAVFLGNPNLKRESIGTGVFLPRQIGAPTETRKKKDTKTKYRKNVLTAEQRRQEVAKDLRPDLRLPPEWTY